MKELYILSIEESELVSEEYCKEHFPVRLERAGKYRFREDKLRCIGAGVLLCGAAGIRESELSFNEYGKPLCEGRNFSISHSGKYIILAVSDNAVGTDIECMARKCMDIEKRVCTEAELAWLDAGDAPASAAAAMAGDVQVTVSETAVVDAPATAGTVTGNVQADLSEGAAAYTSGEINSSASERTRRFYMLWTLKESIMKAEGRGLTMEAGSIDVLAMVRGDSISINGRKYYGESFEIDGHMISVCGTREPAARILVTREMLQRWEHKGSGCERP